MIKETEDLNLIKELWKPYTKELGHYFDAYLKKYHFFIYYVDNKPAGFVNYEIHNKLKEVEIGELLVLPEYRGQHISTRLIEFIYQQVESLLVTLNYKLVVKAYEGLPNNKMYEHISTEHYYCSNAKNYTYIKYVLDQDRIRRSIENDTGNN